MEKLAKQSMWAWILLGISATISFLDHLCNIEYYKSGAVLIPSAVGMILGYGMTLAILIVRKIQNDRIKKEQSESEQ